MAHKIGEKSFPNMIDKGFREMGGLWEGSNIVHAGGYDSFWNSRQSEVGRDVGLDQEKGSTLDSRINQVGPPRDDPGRDDRGMDRE